MCGIVGVVDLSGRPVEPDLVAAMNARIVHRGPDEDGAWLGDGAGLAMRRLSILDLSGGRQPFFDESGQVLTVYNGEIYNYPSLRKAVLDRGHTLRSTCDTELLPHLYEDHGQDFVRHLNGMFAIALWDRRRRALLLARDRLGIKPLHYARRDGRFYFASELKALQPCGVLGETDPEAVYHYLTYGYVPAPLTIYKDVFKLPPAHCLELVGGEVRVSRYWDVEYRPAPPRPEAEVVEALHELMLDAVRLQLISDVPLGAFLSGGVDSSVVVALMSQVASGRVKTFSIAFEESDHDESTYARAVAERFSTDHRVMTVRPDIWRQVDDIVLQFDEPFADSSAIPTYFLSKLTREHVTVALSGDGGDELFGGYERYRSFFKKRPLFRIPGGLRRATAGTLGELLPRGARGKRFLRSLRLDPLEDYVAGGGELTHAELLAPEFLARVRDPDPVGPARPFLSRAVPSELDSLCLHDIALYLPDDILTKVDRTSMAVSLEARVPILDHRVVEFAATLPEGLRLREGTGKYVLKKLLERYMPQEHVHRQKKGFGVPLGAWFRHELRDELQDTLHPDRLRRAGVFRPEAVDFLMRQHAARERDHQTLLWRLFVFHLWEERRSGSGGRTSAPLWAEAQGVARA
jgi:asparagine synthase (glutamine-hydrolysing)